MTVEDSALGGIGGIIKGGVDYERSSGNSALFTNASYSLEQLADSFRWKDKRGNWKLYDSDGHLIQWGDRLGIICTISYTADGKPLSLSDRDGNEMITFETDADGNITAAVDTSGRRVEYGWSGGRMSSVKDVRGYTESFEYDSKGRLKRRVDGENQETLITYDGYGNPASVTDGEGVGWFFQFDFDEGRREYYARVTSSGGTVKEHWYDRDGDTVRVDLNGRTIKRILQDGRNWEVIDEAGRRTRKEYDEWDNLTRVVYPDGSVVTHTYERNFNRRTSTVNENGVETRFEYDASGNLTRKVEAAGTAEERVTEYQYDASNNLTLKRISGVGGVVETNMTYDVLGNLTSITDAEGNTTGFTHDISGNILTRTDARNKLWSYDYDPAGNLLKITDPLSHERSFEYDGVGRKVKMIEALNHETIFAYDRRGNPVLSIDPMGGETHYFYDADGHLIRVVDPEGHETTYAYDLDGRRVKMVDGSSNVTTMEYSDSGSGCSSCSNSPNSPSRINFPTFAREFQYDARGRKISEMDIAGSETLTTAFTYDPIGNLKIKTDREGRSSYYDYDPLDRLSRVTDPLNGQTLYSYDARGNLTSLTDAEGQTTYFEYDGNNRLVKEVRPLFQETQYHYDPVGNLDWKIDAKNQKTEFRYNDAGRPEQILYYASASDTTPAKIVVFTYDFNGNLKSYDDGTTSATYDYDLADRKISETVDYGDFILSYSYSYYKNGAKKSLTYPDGTVLSYSYNESDELQAVNIPGVGAITTSEYQWNRPKTMTLPGGGEKNYDYDPLIRVRAITSKDPAGNSVMSYQYTYDKMDNITAKNTEHGDYIYGYDPLDRLTAADKPASQSDEIFTYDKVGNRLTSADTSGNWDYNDNNELQGFDDITYQHDSNGNTISRIQNGVGQHYIYNLENRLQRVEDDSGTTIASYYYDPYGRRLWKDVGGIKLFFHYGDEGLLGEYDATGAIIKIYGWKPGSMWSTDPLYMQQGGYTYFFQNDDLGTPQKMTTATGAVVWSAHYSSFGKAIIDPASTVENNLRYPGQYEDVETALYYNWWRYYDSSLGRYFCPDPLGVDEGVNLYLYVYNKLNNAIDPTGLSVHYGKYCDDNCCSCSSPKFIEKVRYTGAIKYEQEYYIGVVAAEAAKERIALLKLLKDIADRDPTITPPTWNKVQTGLNKFFAQEATYTCWSEMCESTGDTYLNGCKLKPGTEKWQRDSRGDKKIYEHFFY